MHIVLYGTARCKQAQNMRHVLKNLQSEYSFTFSYVDIDFNDEGRAFVKTTNKGNLSVPTFLFPNDETLTEPSVGVLRKMIQTQSNYEKEV